MARAKNPLHENSSTIMHRTVHSIQGGCHRFHTAAITSCISHLSDPSPPDGSCRIFALLRHFSFQRDCFDQSYWPVYIVQRGRAVARAVLFRGQLELYCFASSSSCTRERARAVLASELELYSRATSSSCTCKPVQLKLYSRAYYKKTHGSSFSIATKNPCTRCVETRVLCNCTSARVLTSVLVQLHSDLVFTQCVNGFLVAMLEREPSALFFCIPVSARIINACQFTNNQSK